MVELTKNKEICTKIFFMHEVDSLDRLKRKYEKSGKDVVIERVSGYLQMYNPNNYFSFNSLFKKPEPVVRRAIVESIDESLGIEYSHSKYSDFYIMKVYTKDN